MSTNPLRFSVELRLSTHLETGPGDTDSDADTETDLHLSPSPTEHRPRARLAHPGLDRTHFSPFQPLGTGVTSTSAPADLPQLRTPAPTLFLTLGSQRQPQYPGNTEGRYLPAEMKDDKGVCSLNCTDTNTRL